MKYIRSCLIACAAVMVGAALSACGSSSSPASTAGVTLTSASASAGGSTAPASGGSVTGAQLEARVNVAKCLRSHGIDVPDPRPAARHRARSSTSKDITSSATGGPDRVPELAFAGVSPGGRSEPAGSTPAAGAPARTVHALPWDRHPRSAGTGLGLGIATRPELGGPERPAAARPRTRLARACAPARNLALRSPSSSEPIAWAARRHHDSFYCSQTRRVA